MRHPRHLATLARRKFTARLPTAAYDAIAASGVPITQVIEEAVQLWLDRQRQPPTPELPEETAIPAPSYKICRTQDSTGELPAARVGEANAAGAAQMIWAAPCSPNFRWPAS
jgi:hypothetical protein